MDEISVDEISVDEISVDELEGRLASQAARNAANTFEYLMTLEEFDRREGWVGDGVRSFAHWLNWKIGTDIRVAQGQLPVAKALKVLPLRSGSFSRGELSYSRVRAITGVALPDTEAMLVEVGDAGAATLTDGTVLDFATRRRLECDASTITIGVDKHGNEVPGPNSSGISAGLRRALMLRDRSCRWPGCTAEYHLHAHHVMHRADLGRTVLDNLILLCGHHHRVLHADGYGIVPSVDETWTFTRSDGSVIDPIPIQLGVQRNAQLSLLPPRLTIVLNWDGTRLDARNIDRIPILRPDTYATSDSDSDSDSDRLPETG
ncbi:MAG: hypothetical protein ACI8Y4_000115 [Candidatus Poriferisodalaceae bacterium]